EHAEMHAVAFSTASEPIVAAGGVRDVDVLKRLMSLEIHGRRLAGVVVVREVTQGRFTIAEAKEVIAAGPDRTITEPPKPEPLPRGTSSTPPLLADAAAAYLRAAEAAESAA